MFFKSYFTNLTNGMGSVLSLVIWSSSPDTRNAICPAESRYTRTVLDCGYWSNEKIFHIFLCHCLSPLRTEGWRGRRRNCSNFLRTIQLASLRQLECPLGREIQLTSYEPQYQPYQQYQQKWDSWDHCGGRILPEQENIFLLLRSKYIIVTSPSLGSSGYPFFSSSSRIPEATKARPQRKQPVTILCSGVVRRPNFPGRDDGWAWVYILPKAEGGGLGIIRVFFHEF